MDTTIETPEVKAAREQAEAAKAAYEAAYAASQEAERAARQAAREAAQQAEQVRRDAELNQLLVVLKDETAPLREKDFGHELKFAYGSWGGEATADVSLGDDRCITIGLTRSALSLTIYTGSRFDTTSARFPVRKDGTYNWTKAMERARDGITYRLDALDAKRQRTDYEAAFLAKAEQTLTALAAAFPTFKFRTDLQRSAPGGKHYSAQRCRAMLSCDAFSVVLSMVGNNSDGQVNVEVNGNMSDGDFLLRALVAMAAQVTEGIG